MTTIQEKRIKKRTKNVNKNKNDWINFITSVGKDIFRLIIMTLIASNIVFSSKAFTNNTYLPTDSTKEPYYSSVQSSFPYQYKIESPSNTGEKIINWFVDTIITSWIGSRIIIKETLLVIKQYMYSFMNIKSSSTIIENGIKNIINYILILTSMHIVLPLFLLLSTIGGGLGLLIGGFIHSEGFFHKIIGIITSFYMSPIVIIQVLYTFIMFTIQPIIKDYKHYVDFFKQYSGFITTLFILYMLSDAYTYLNTTTFMGIVIGIIIMYISYIIKLFI